MARKEGLEDKKNIKKLKLKDESILRRNKRAIVVILATMTVFTLISYLNLQIQKKDQKKLSSNLIPSSRSIKNEAEREQKSREKMALDKVLKVNTDDWVDYKNNWYGFSVKYPKEWPQPRILKGTFKDNWEQKFLFRKKEKVLEDSFSGFDVVIYNVSKVKQLYKTDEFKAVDNLPENGSNSNCTLIDGHLTENSQFPADEVYIPAGDECYKSALFFTLTREKYIYNLVPIAVDSASDIELTKTKTDVMIDFPEFFASAKCMQLIDIVKPKVEKPKPKITAPRPVAAVKNSKGQLVCAKKNDKPHKSKQNKGHHLDMECCLDPDEDPNPWCTY